MNNIKAIRKRLGVTQVALADGMGCTQGNVGHYERGQTVPPSAAKRLIAYAATLGHAITFDGIYDIAHADPTLDTEMAEAAQAGLIERRFAKEERREINRAKDAKLAAFGASEARRAV